MEIRLLRHATLVVDIAGTRLLVDPMLSRAGAMDPVGNAASTARIPMVELPLDDDALGDLIGTVDAVLVTHTHRDHWDARAIELLPKDVPLFCQPPDVTAIGGAGFTDARDIDDTFDWRGIHLSRTGGRHGSGELGKQMGPVSGFVLRAPGEPVLYIAGDTVWCAEVETALREHAPDVIVLNAGAAQFLSGEPITMGMADVAAVCRAAPEARVIAVHMDTINHCLLTRRDLARGLREMGLADRVMIPADGERIKV
jgi:L-ascorbate metabolism protein UlaG (beta-lactamase superfamily)